MNDRQETKAAKRVRGEPSERLDDLARRVIGAAIEVHKHLGPGFAENVYEAALSVELGLRQIPFARQPAVEVEYMGHSVGLGRPDFVIGDALVVELKAVRELAPTHQAQMISYLKSMRTELGLLLNFREVTMRKGIRRVIWTHESSYRQQQTSDVNEAHEAGESLVVSRSDAAVALEVVKEDFNSIA